MLMSLPAKSLTVRLSGLGKINKAIKLAMKPIENMINGNIFGLMEKYRFIKYNRYRLTTIVTPNKRKNSKLLLNKLFGVFIKAIFSSMNAPIETEIKIVKNINA